jgi:hypothetical protein
MPANRRYVCLILVLITQSAAAEEAPATPPCATHTLTAEKVKEQLFGRSQAAFANWGVLTIELAPCASNDGVAARIVLSLPNAWSSLGVSYRLRLSYWLDPEKGAPIAGKKNSVLQVVSTRIKALLPRIEQEESVRSFVERYQPLLAWIDADSDTQKLHFEFQSTNQEVASVQLLLQDGVSGFVVGYRLAHIDGLPVRRELLRFAELVSIQQPRCRVSDIKAQRQESPSDEKTRKTFWAIEAKLHGKGCQSAFAVTVDENGNQAPDTED